MGSTSTSGSVTDHLPNLPADKDTHGPYISPSRFKFTFTVTPISFLTPRAEEGDKVADSGYFDGFDSMSAHFNTHFLTWNVFYDPKWQFSLEL